MEGRDEKWILLPANNKIEYSNLYSGNYSFVIKQGKDGKPEPAFFSSNR
ncbi:triple tyrosine motif-containing protein [Flavobacterium procerum]